MTIYHLLNLSRYLNGNPPLTEIEKGVWAPARPHAYWSFWQQLREAWLVFRRKGDVLLWPEDAAHLFVKHDWSPPGKVRMVLAFLLALLGCAQVVGATAWSLLTRDYVAFSLTWPFYLVSILLGIAAWWLVRGWYR